MDNDVLLKQAAELISSADALLIGAGAGMSVDSGLPDFRGNTGFWNVYPTLFGRPFHEVANPRWFHNDPSFAWGFYGHRFQLYQKTEPHAGYHVLRRWAERMPAGYFVYTSNVDGHFQKAGFAHDRCLECHGSILHLQCTAGCSNTIWQADNLELTIEPTTLRAVSSLPKCPQCQAIARPNILMFGDGQWIETRTLAQSHRYSAWRQQLRAQGKRLVAIEIGAGTAIPTVRYECEHQTDKLIRINPRDAVVAGGGIGLAMEASKALGRMDEWMTLVLNKVYT